ncbi:magnesium transporter NIPA-domain-containing protein [Radiomyces spectabilis]|uniref:magnesium transporter NIPA-domain-containing protein n=1 Tax=Radiomyces spectabilis TaxID=64574 RepID=UPI00221F9037|nr:magnesium transporter NIPA-domain-containing protein [Radiomyces spectabilis]KAI8367607.1 magnesium transporter NIPA-domain-containing protein [Radiomyces spectabilis]
MDVDVAFNTFIGVLVSVCGNILISVALNVQKLAHNQIQKQQLVNYFANTEDSPPWISTSHHVFGNHFFPDDGYSSPRTSEDYRTQEEEMEHRKFIMAMAQEQAQHNESDYLKSKLWWLGISLMVLGEVGNFVAYGFAPASTIAPLGTTTLVSNVILAPLILKEVFRKRDLLGVCLAVLGAGMVVLSSNEDQVTLSPELIMETLTETRSIIYFIISGVAIVTLTIASPLYGKSSIMIDLGLVAIYGGYTVICTKSLASLLSMTLFKMFAYPVSYVLIIVLVATAILQIKYLNKALQRFDSTEVIPTQFVLFTISAIVGSAALYHDFDNMSMEQMSRFMTGCAVEFLGVYLITSKRNNRLELAMEPTDRPVTSFTNDEAEHADLEIGNNAQTLQRLMPLDTNNPPRSSFGHGDIEPFLRSSPNASSLGDRARSNFLNQLSSSPDHWHGFATDGGSYHPHRRSSVFRGISLTSQLMDRISTEMPSKSPVQLSSSPVRKSFFFGNRRSDTTMGSLLNGLARLSTDTAPDSRPRTTDADAVEIEIPTATAVDIAHQRELTLMRLSNGSHHSPESPK